MKKLLRQLGMRFLVASLLTIGASGIASAQVADPALANSLEQIIARYPRASVGVEVQSINSGNIIFTHNAQQLFTPASTLKTFTAAAALLHLGADFTFKTRMFAAPHSFDATTGSLNSDLYIYFDGDPTLKREDLNRFLAVLTQLGVRTINGNIYLDNSAFDNDEYGPGWLWSDRNYCYSASTSAIALDHNCFPITIAPSRRLGAPPIVSAGAGYDFIRFVNNAVTSNPNSECAFKLQAANNNTYILSGCVRPRSGSVGFSLATWDLRSFAAGTLAHSLRQRGIGLTGSIKFGKIPPTAQLATLAGHDSAPLFPIIKFMLKKSDNLFADSIYKKLGQLYTGGVGTWTTGAFAVEKILGDAAHISFSGIKIVDGCGLSRSNLVTPHVMASLLNYVYRNENLRAAFWTALPIAGIDGHLQGRMVNLQGRVRAKTGTTKTVTGLAGFIYTNRGQMLSFAILVNNFTDNVHHYQRLEDEICETLATRM